MRHKRLLIIGNVFLGLGLIFSGLSGGFSGEGDSKEKIGGAIGMAIIASTFILCGAFFLYKHFTSDK